jgi:hypothetical protein
MNAGGVRKAGHMLLRWQQVVGCCCGGRCNWQLLLLMCFVLLRHGDQMLLLLLSLWGMQRCVLLLELHCRLRLRHVLGHLLRRLHLGCQLRRDSRLRCCMHLLHH